MIFSCKNCGGNMIYSPEKHGMFCPFCDGENSEEVIRNNEPRTCNHCGGVLTAEQFAMTTRCPYCGDYIIYEDRIQGAYEPQKMIPFQLGKEKVKEILHSKFKAKIFAPDSFLAESTLEDMQGDYVPFFMFDYQANYDYQAIGTKVRSWTTGNTRYTEHSEYQIHRNMDIDFDDIPADAANDFDDKTMDLLEPYDYQGICQFDPKYLSGFDGEVYNAPPLTFAPRAEEKARNDAKELMKNTVTGYATVVPSVDHLELKRNEIQYTLLPVWRYRYSYQQKQYVFYINGQTGKVVGDVPISTLKVLAYSLTSGVGVAIIVQLMLLLLNSL